jgi:hypothetical protein
MHSTGFSARRSTLEPQELIASCSFLCSQWLQMLSFNWSSAKTMASLSDEVTTLQQRRRVAEVVSGIQVCCSFQLSGPASPPVLPPIFQP